MVVANHHVWLDTREGAGIGRTYQAVTGFAGLPAPCGRFTLADISWRLHALSRIKNHAEITNWYGVSSTKSVSAPFR